MTKALFFMLAGLFTKAWPATFS